MTDEPECQLRRRKVSGNTNLPLNLDVVSDGEPDQGTPSPSNVKRLAFTKKKSSSFALLDYKNKQQSFDIQVDECEVEEIFIDSDDDEGENAEGVEDHSITPTPIQDFAANVFYTEDEDNLHFWNEMDWPTVGADHGGEGSPQATGFLRVKAIENDCYTDVSDADSDEEENE